LIPVLSHLATLFVRGDRPVLAACLVLPVLIMAPFGVVVSSPRVARAAGEYAVVAGSGDNEIHLAFEHAQAMPPIVEILAQPAFIENLRIDTADPGSSDIVIRFDVAGGAELDEHATLVARIEVSNGPGERLAPIMRRWPLRIAAEAPASQSSYRLAECCLAPEDVEVNGDGLPLRSQLVGGAPNPWRGVTRIRFGLAEGGAPVTVRIHDITGRRVCEIHTPHLPAGFHQITWNGADDTGQALPPGLYLYEITAGSWKATGRSLLIR
jgi:hypothetical protein